LRRHPLDREIYRLAVPALGSLAIEPLVSLVDTAFVGRLGSAELAGLGIAGAVFLWSFFAFIFLAYATTTIVAQALGAGDDDHARRTATTAFVTAVGAGGMAVVVLEALAVPAVAVFGGGGEAADIALTYVRIRALSAPAVLIALAGNGVFRGHQDTRTPLGVAAVVSAINLVLDPALIFGAGLGVAGAAWASVAAQWAGAVLFVAVAARRNMIELERGVVTGDSVGELAAAGTGVGLRTVALLGAFSGATAVAARVGDDAVAAHRIVDQLFFFLALSVDALAVAVQAMVGRRLGTADLVGARRVARRVFELGLMAGVGLAVLLVVLRGVLPGVFTNDQGVLGAVTTIYWFLVALQPLNAVVFVGDGVLLGWSAYRYMAAATWASAVAAGIVLSLVLPLDLGLVGVYAALSVLMVGRGVGLAWWWRRLR
jgi:MATE family multidrug resistance protein